MPGRRIEDFPPGLRQVIEKMPALKYSVALSELTTADFIHLAELRLKEEMMTYGPGRQLRQAIDRLQEAGMWHSTFDPERDAVVAPPPAVAVATPEEIDAVNRGKS